MFLYLTTDGLTINKNGWKFIIYDPHQDAKRHVPISLIEGIVLLGNIQLTTWVIKTCLQAKIPVFFLSKRWTFFWKLDSLEVKNIELMYNHIQASLDKEISLKYAKTIVKSKIENSKVMLLRWRRFFTWIENIEDLEPIIENLKKIIKSVEKVDNIDTLRWVEWNAAKVYYKWFSYFINNGFEFKWRNKRPPRDEINSMLSLWYTLLAQTIQMILDIQWLNTQIWFYHQPKDLRTLLVLDIMEMFRAWVVDDLVVKLIRREKIKKDDFWIDEENEKRPVFFEDNWLKLFLWEYYKAIFKKWNDEFEIENKFLKLKIIEKNIEQFKQSLLTWKFNYEGFKIK